MKIAVLALQGAFIEHIHCLQKLGVETKEIRQKKDFTEDTFDGLIIPGGESTVIGKLLRDLDLFDSVLEFIKNGKPVFGTCAGLILLAEEISNDDNRYFATLPVKVKRNAYGRQLGSFSVVSGFSGKDIPQTFIRAPYIEKIFDDKCEILSSHNGFITAVKYENQLACAFHPELTDDISVHQYFIDMCKKS